MLPTTSNRRLAALASITLIVTACAVGPDYVRPETPALPAAFVNAPPAEFGSQGAESSWWRQFNDPKLTRLIELAVTGNRDVKVAAAQLRQARSLFLQAGLELLPVITAHGNWTDQRRSFSSLNRRNFVPRDLRLFNTGFDATWEIDLFGRVRRNVEAQEAEVEVAEANHRDVLVSVVSELALNYFALRGHQSRLQVARSSAQSQTSTYELTQVKQTVGTGTALDTARALDQLNSTLASIPPLESLIHQDMHRIAVLTGQQPTALYVQLQSVAPLPQPPDLVQIGRPSELLRRRPDIRAAERSLAGATSQIGVAVADLFPRVTFTGTLALESQSFLGLGAAASDAHSFGPRITWAALDLGRVLARIQAANEGAAANAARYEQTVLTALEETENALVNYNRTRAQEVLLAKAADASETAYGLAKERFDSGVDDFLTVLIAEQTRLTNQDRKAQGAAATAAALVALYKALGGGWENFMDSEHDGGKLKALEGAFSP